MSIYKLDDKDKLILYLLDRNARMPTSKISRIVKLSKPAVEHRIEKLILEGVISKFQLVINPVLFGYEHFKVYMQLQNTDINIENEILDYLKSLPTSFWIVSARGRWDILFSVHSKDVREFGDMLRVFMDKFSEYILTRTVNILERALVFNRSYFFPEGKRFALVYGGSFKPAELDDLDIKILNSLRLNSREKLINISKKICVSPETVRVRIKKMEEKKLIQGYKIGINLDKIGYESYLIAFKFRILDSKIWDDISSFANSNSNILYLSKTIGTHDLDIELEVKDSRELGNFINSFRNRFGNYLQGFESVQLTCEHKLEFYHDLAIKTKPPKNKN